MTLDASDVPPVSRDSSSSAAATRCCGGPAKADSGACCARDEEAEPALEWFLVARNEQDVVAAVGLEIFGGVALRRSLDQAAGEVCPVWPGQPITAHWGVQDPAAAEGTDSEKLAVFNEVFRELESRIKIFCSLPLASLDRVRIKEHVEEIGRTAVD